MIVTSKQCTNTLAHPLADNIRSSEQLSTVATPYVLSSIFRTGTKQWNQYVANYFFHGDDRVKL